MIRTGVSSVARAASRRSAKNVAVVASRKISSMSRGVAVKHNVNSNVSMTSNKVKVVYAVKRNFSSALPAHEVLSMPALSPTMEKGNIASWEKKVGDKVSAGDVICNVQTDKAVVSFDSTEDGYIAKILVEAGASDIDVGTPVAILVEDEADVAAFANYTAAGSAAPAAATPVAEPEAPKSCGLYIAPESPKAVVITNASKQSTSSSGRVLATPAARIAAMERGVDISTVNGTAANRTICKADVMEFVPTAAPASVPADVKAAISGVPTVDVDGDYEDVPNSMMRKVIAKRLTESKQEIPHYYVTMECEVDAVNKLRTDFNKQLAEQAKKNGDEVVPKLSVNDFVIKAVAAALKKVPAVNASWQETSIRNYNYVDISVAVATENGLITPIIADADLKGFAAISSEMKSLAKKARENKLQPHEYQGGTFTISNLGMFGVKNFTAIINPPQAGILAVGSSDVKVVPNPAYTPENGESQFKTVNVMSVSASFDHRVVDGAVGAQFLAAFKQYIESPMKLLL